MTARVPIVFREVQHYKSMMITLNLQLIKYDRLNENNILFAIPMVFTAGTI